MRKIFSNILLMAFLCCPLVAAAQENKSAEQLLDKAVAAIKADGGVQMGFTFTLLDAGGEKQFKDNGVLKIDGNRYALLTDEMKLWCDGKTQWSYISQNNEIYISEPNADDARAFSPLHIMELYKDGFSSAMDSKCSTAKANAVVLTPFVRGNEIKKVFILLDKQTNLPASLVVDYDNGTSADIIINSYKKGCKFAVKEFRCREKDFRGAEVVDMR